MTRSLKILLILLLSFTLTGCRSPEDLLERDGKAQNITRDNENQAVVAVKESNKDNIGYQFITEKGTPITVESNSEYTWYVPEQYLNVNITSAPIEYSVDDLVVTIGFAGVKQAKDVDRNVYEILYLSMLDNFVKQLGRGEQIRKQLVKSLNMYEVENIKLPLDDTEFKKKDVLFTRSKANYSYFDERALAYFLPCLQASIQMDDGEKIVVFVQASTNTKLWDRTVLPTPFELELGQEFGENDLHLLEDISKQCSKYHDRLEKQMLETLKLIHIGDLSNKYRLVSLNYTNNYGVDVTQFDKYCFLKLQDGSVYLLSEKDSMKSVQFISGSDRHQIPAEWDKFNMEVEDLADGSVYEFKWESHN